MNRTYIARCRIRTLALMASIALSLAGCGGGGGGSETGEPEPVDPPAQPPVLTAPAITQAPQSVARFVGAPVSLTVVATGSQPLAYQWFRDGQAISGAVAADHVLISAQPTDAGTYHVVVRNAAGEVASQAAQLTVGGNAPQVATSYSHTLALTSGGRVFAWGDNRSGQLGDGSTVTSTRPVAVQTVAGTPLDDIAAIAAVDGRSFALRRDGVVLAWGGNQLLPAPVAIDASGVPLTGVVAIAASAAHVLALRGDGSLVAWGGAVLIGNPLSNGDYPAPVVDGTGQPVTGIASISASHSHSLAVRTDGSVLAWGINLYGELGDGTTEMRGFAAPVMDGTGAALAGIRAVSAGEYTSYALRIDGGLMAWGDNLYGKLGDGTQGRAPFPVATVDASGHPLTGLHSIRAGLEHVVALRTDGCVLSWGSNVWLQLGLPQPAGIAYRPYAAAVDAGAGSPLCGALAVASGNRYASFAIDDTGGLLGWGRNDHGHLGDGTTVHRPLPVRVLLPEPLF
jgi:alpha-tubulin suppressor-like RCC1 family protein